VSNNRPMSIRSVLVVGVGIGGSSLAYWLAHHGIATTVVEQSQGQRSSGGLVDVRGAALAVVKQMDLLAPLREAATLASCVSLFGEGSSMAIVGATTLAQALVAQPNDPAAALRRYERIHRKRLLPRQRGVAITSHLLVPATRTGIAARNAAFRLWPGITAARRRGRPPESASQLA
jgi:2-polyprenyl-6-methoxyphenol hydroxylase-like FAD-dependent oxidoreductase